MVNYLLMIRRTLLCNGQRRHYTCTNVNSPARINGELMTLVEGTLSCLGGVRSFGEPLGCVILKGESTSRVNLGGSAGNLVSRECSSFCLVLNIALNLFDRAMLSQSFWSGTKEDILKRTS